MINYFTTFDAANINIWSGLGVYYRTLLEKGGFSINDISYKSFPNRYIHSIKRRIYSSFGKRYSPRFDVSVSRFYAKEVANTVRYGSVIFTPNIEALAFLDTGYKKVLHSDATFERLLNFYSSYSNFTNKAISTGHEIERRALKNADLVIYTSEWAAESAITFYNADPKKIHIIPFAANLSCLPTSHEAEANVMKRDLAKRVELVFFGTDWERKGGDTALKIVEGLNKNGVESVLHVVGIRRFPEDLDQTYIINHGFFSKDDKKNQEVIVDLLLKSHFLILPSKADCTPIVFSEANSCALPCIASNVGGNSSIIKDNINGKTFSLQDFAGKAIDYITVMQRSPQQYKDLCFSTYDHFSKELNIDAVATKVSRLISSL